MKALTFVGLGTGGGYQSAKYVHDEKVVESNLFPVALYELFHPDQMTVFVTEQSKARYWDELCQKLAGKITPNAVEIPWGGKPDELWMIFDRVVQSVDEGEEVLFDITHGFRSLPFVVFLAVAYLRLVKHIRVGGIVYGAFDAKDASGRAPVFDLSPFLSLLDWITAVHLFTASGSSTEISRLLKDIQAQARRNPTSQQLPTQLNKVGARMEELSQAFLLIRPLEVMEKAGQLSAQFTEIMFQEIDQWAKPFALVAPVLQDQTREFAVSPDVRNLDVQRHMVDWYGTRGLYVQSLTLARELLVTKVSLLLGHADPVAESSRNESATVLNYLAWQNQSTTRQKPWEGVEPCEAATQVAANVNVDSLVRLWSKIGKARNDVDHAGMRAHPSNASRLVSKTREILTELDTLINQEKR